MIILRNKEEAVLVMKYFYSKGWSWISYPTLEDYKLKMRNEDYPYNIHSFESLEKIENLYPGQKYIRCNDMWEITGEDYIKKLRVEKLERILK